MKPSLLCALLITLFATSSLLAESSLHFSDPRSWYGTNGRISESTLTITPKGAYWLYSLEMTYSAANTNVGNSYDTLEVIHQFTLPKEAIVTDSWLWVDTIPVQAFIVERALAQSVYEGIVKRRKDPSILTKISETQYQFRVFPMPGNVPRKVRLSFLIPATFTKTGAESIIPTNILSSADNAIVPRLIVHTDSSFHTPSLWQSTQVGIIFSPIANSAYTTYIPNANIKNTSALKLHLSGSIKNGVFFGTFPTSDSTGFYQLAVIPGEVLNITPPTKKVAFLLDYESAKSNFTPAQILQVTKDHVLATFSPTDSFNIFAGKQNVVAASPTWIPADSASVISAFRIMTQVPLTYSNLPNLFSAAISFIKAHGNNASIHLSSASDNFLDKTTADALQANILASMNPKIQTNIISLSNINLKYQYHNNGYYEGNDYLYRNLTAQTGGYFYNLQVENYDSYYYPPHSLSPEQQLNKSFETLNGILENFESTLTMDSGISYSRYDIKGTSNIWLYNPTIQIGKYYGKGRFSANLMASFYGTFLSQTMALANTYATDSSTRLMWSGSYQAALEPIATGNSQSMQLLINSSISNRILCKYTAFLALEPGMDTLLCADCSDPQPPLVGISELSAMTVSASPNPFSAYVTIATEGILMTKDASIEIKDIQGRTVYLFDKTNTDNLNNLVWNGTDQYGGNVAKGMYLAIIKSGNAQKLIKIIKL